LTAQKDIIEKTIGAIESLTRSQELTRKLEARQVELGQERSVATGIAEEKTRKQRELEKDEEHLLTQLTVLKHIKDLESERSRLQDGEACPLCGALEHPFAKGNVPIPDETKKQLETVRGGLKTIAGEISDLKVKLAKLDKDIQQTATSLEEHSDKSAEALKVIGHGCAALECAPKLEASDPELTGKLSLLRDENLRQAACATEILETADSIEKELNVLRESLEKAQASVAKRELDLQSAVNGEQSARQSMERLAKEEQEVRERLSGLLKTLEKETVPYGITQMDIEKIEEVRKGLEERRSAWVLRNAKRSELDRKITELQARTSAQFEQIAEDEKAIKRQQESLQRLLQEQEDLRRQRRELFGEKVTDEEEKRLADAVEAAGKRLEEARQKASEASQALSVLAAGIKALEDAVQTRTAQLKSADESFQSRLESYGFANEDAYRAACLPESERTLLAQEAQRLSDRKNELASKESEKTRLLNDERQKNITNEPLDELKKAVEALATTHRELQQEIGGIRQKLVDNDLVKQRQQERIAGIEAQKREFSKWDRLHALIGSADGKKYRNFAQGLTFEMLVGHANRQLQKMSDRYLLVRDNKIPLELNVIDNYQAGEIRSTKNLSGGESFIVSLSLALGLSQMASRNVRVDSLFLDEGFGTLDDEALETALETLAGLRQDGKLIGVISHVAALKERISAQIQVVPQSGGRSHLSGPGCSRVCAAGAHRSDYNQWT